MVAVGKKIPPSQELQELVSAAIVCSQQVKHDVYICYRYHPPSYPFLDKPPAREMKVRKCYRVTPQGEVVAYQGLPTKEELGLGTNE